MFQHLEYQVISSEEMVRRSARFLTQMKSRRSVRDFSDRPIPIDVMKNIVITAASAPSGANKQPWKFIIVNDLNVKRRIRLAAEKEEKENYERRFTQTWLEDLKQFGTDRHKEFLEKAPYLIVVFKQVYHDGNSGHLKNYYVNESVGIATGFLLTAIHRAGLVALTHTPSPMSFLSEILHRPPNEKPFLIIPVGYPDNNARVPVLTKKTFEEVCEIY